MTPQNADADSGGLMKPFGRANYTYTVKATLLNRILVVLAFLGLFVAGVLSLEAGMHLEVPCGPSGGCAIVAAAPSSRLLDIPVAYFGLLGYLALAALAVYRTMLPTFRWSRLVTLGYLLSAVGSAESLWLQYQSFFVIHAECPWCITSAVTMIVTLVVYALLAQEMENVPPAEFAIPDSTPDGALPAGDDWAEAHLPPATRSRSEMRLPAVMAVVVILGVSAMGSLMKRAEGGVGPPPKNASNDVLIPPGAHILGIATSPLTVVEFVDMCCPVCQRVSPKVRDYVLNHPGKLRLVYRNYPIINLHPQAMNAAAIAECAGDEGRFWEYETAVMSLQRQPKDVDELMQIAQSTGLNVDKIRKRLTNTDDPVYARLDRDLQAVKTLGITSTPTFITVAGGKALETIGPGEILKSLDSAKYQKIMNGAHA